MIQSVLSILMQVIIPLSVPVVAGILLVRFQGLETKPLLPVALYFLAPAMIFTNLSAAQLSYEDLTYTVLFCLLNMGLMWTVAFTAGKILRLPASEQAGLTLMATLSNAVNYGMPLVQLSLGQSGMEKAALYVVIQQILTNTLGVYFAARSNFSIRQSIKSIFKLPSIYAAILAACFRLWELNMPIGLEKGISMAAQAYSPIMLVVLGAQMVSVKNSELGGKYKLTFYAGIGLRTLLSPLVAFLVMTMLGISGTLFSVFLILASTPVAVNAVLFAEKYGASPNIVSKGILWTTLLSFAVLPILISFVR